MSCPWPDTELGAYLDGELDADRGRELEEHLEGCARCREELDALAGLAARLRADAPRYHAPELLRERIRRDIHAEFSAGESAPAAERPGIEAPRSGRPAASTRLRRLAPARLGRLAAAACLVITAGIGGYGIGRGRSAAAARDALTDEVLASHLRSLLPGRLTDVASTDQHQVKPWFAGRLPYSPPVPNLDARGFPLAGGRIDYVDSRPVAVLVYHRRLHAIDVYVWPAGEAPRAAPASGRRGYHLLAWRDADFVYLAVTDAASAELETLRRLFQAETASR